MKKGTNSTKGQAALEFLTTYGWAMMVLLVMIGALTYFGVINPYSLLPEKCVFGTGVACGDYVAYVSDPDTNLNGESTIRAQLNNGFGFTVSIIDVSVFCEGVTSSEPCKCDNTNDYCSMTAVSQGGTTWRSDQKKELIIDFGVGGITEGDRPKIDVTINYKKGGGSYEKSVSGVINVKPLPAAVP